MPGNRISQIEGTLKLSATSNWKLPSRKNADNVDVFRRTIKSLETAIADIQGRDSGGGSQCDLDCRCLDSVMLAVVKAARRRDGQSLHLRAAFFRSGFLIGLIKAGLDPRCEPV